MAMLCGPLIDGSKEEAGREGSAVPWWGRVTWMSWGVAAGGVVFVVERVDVPRSHWSDDR